MAANPPSDTALRVSALSPKAPTSFDLSPSQAEMAEIAAELGLVDLRKLRFQGQIETFGKEDWQLTGQLGATVIQPCVVTLAPVTTRIDMPVQRKFIANWHDPDEPEAEMPEDDEAEPLDIWIDPGAVMREALALALPDYPRADGAELGTGQFTEPGKQAMTDEDVKPFAGLAALKEKLEGSSKK